MAVNTLFRTGEESPWLHRGHDTEALGPGDSSDTGSDMQGVGDAFEAEELGLDPGLVDKSISHRAGTPDWQETDPGLDDTVINYPKK